MNTPSPLGLLLLFYLVLVIPWLALKARRRFRAAGQAQGPPSRLLVWRSTLILQSAILLLAWWTGREFEYPFLAPPTSVVAGLLWGGAALAVIFGMRWILRQSRSEEERRSLVVFQLAPRSPAEFTLKVLLIMLVAVSEEVAYRGVGHALIWWMTGSGYLAALVMALAFAGAHAVQGGKSVVMIFATALVLHGLVAVTGSLLPAIAVHLIYDVVASWWIMREAGALTPDSPPA